MTQRTFSSVGARLRDRRGVALPLALIGLVVVSLLVTGALLSSSTEASISGAFVDGSRSLYDADGGLQTFVAANVGAQLQPGTRTLVVPGSETTVSLEVVRLMERVGAEDSTMRTFAITAQPLRDGRPVGRAVVAMVTQATPPPKFMDANISSAMTIGGDLAVKGNAFEVTGVSTACLPEGQKGVDAVRAAVGSEITVNNEKHYTNFLGVDDNGNVVNGEQAITRSDLTKDELARDVLGGQTLQELIDGIPLRKKWGPRFLNPDGTPRPNFQTRSPYPNFMAPGDTVAVVDANGGTISLEGGTGLLVIVNGGLEMKGNSTFKGIIIVEGNFRLSGNPQVDGALISLDLAGHNTIELDASAIGNGNITVQFDRCMINQAMKGLGQVATDLPPNTKETFAWFELVR